MGLNSLAGIAIEIQSVLKSQRAPTRSGAFFCTHPYKGCFWDGGRGRLQ
jgi:hypothetical protein